MSACINTSTQLLQFNLQGCLQLLCSSVQEDACSMCYCKDLNGTTVDGHSEKQEFWERHRADILQAYQQRKGSRVFCLLKTK